MSQVAVLDALDDAALSAAVQGLTGFLRSAGFRVTGWPAAADVTVVWSDRPCPEPLEESLLDRLTAGHRLLLAGPTLAAWRQADRLLEAVGWQPDGQTPAHEMRVQAGRDAGALAQRNPGLVLFDRCLRCDKTADDVQLLLTAPVGMARHPVATLRGPAAVLILGGSPAVVGDGEYARLFARLLRRITGAVDRPAVRVGLLGFGAIGVEHATAVDHTDGLVVSALCDRRPDRLAAARAVTPEAVTHASASELLVDPEVDLVVVSTPPDSHARWTARALRSGKHCVVEKPFCLTTAVADELIQLAEQETRLLAVYQNRRWDADFLALQRLVRSGAVGEVFHFESFIGGYQHPCNYWHSDERISGGSIYDWGSHYLDWTLQLMPGEPTQVTAATHKRRWHDVTNADHTRVTVRFADGAEAMFVHSDLAAALKPKWYLLGTEGAVVGDWQRERALTRGPTGAAVEDRFAPADAPARLTLHHPDGSSTAVALPDPPRFQFHRELADRLLCGLPMSCRPETSRQVVAVMEAAARSARAGGAPVAPD